MRTQSNATESDEHHQQCRGHNTQQPPMPRLQRGQNKEQELPVKQSCSDGVATGKTVTRPIHERTINKGPLPMHKNLHALVQQHAARHSNN